MSRLMLISLTTCCLVIGCMSGTDDTTPPTLAGLPPAGVPAKGIYQAEFITTHGKFLVEVNREWAPIGADRFYQLIKDQFFDDSGFFRVVPGFVVQFGLPADPAMNEKWSQGLQDEPVLQSNERGFLTFAKSSAPNSRTTQLFISYADNDRLDEMGFSAFGQVIDGMDVVDQINSEYGEQPQQPSIEIQGNAYLQSEFPNLSYIQTARIVKDDLNTESAPKPAPESESSTEETESEPNPVE